MAKKQSGVSLSELTSSLKSSDLKMTPAMQAQFAEKVKQLPPEEPIATVVKTTKQDSDLKKSMTSLQQAIEKLVKVIQENTITITKSKSKSTRVSTSSENQLEDKKLLDYQTSLLEKIEENTVITTNSKPKSIQQSDLSENQIEDRKTTDYQTRLLEKIEENTREKKTDKDEKEEKPQKSSLSKLALLGTLLAASLGAIAGVFVAQAKVMLGTLKLLYKMIPTKLVEAVVNAVRRIPQILNDMVTQVMINIEYAFRIVIDLFKNRFPKTFKVIEDVIVGFRNVFVSIFETGKKVVSYIGKVIVSIANVVVEAFTFLKEGFIKFFADPIKAGIALIKEGSASVSNGVSKIGNFIEGIKNFFTGIGNWLGNFAKVFKGAMIIAEKIALPITIIMGLFDGITEAIKGYEEDGILGGIQGFITGVLNSVVGGFLDLIKNMISWVLDKLGFDNASKFLDSFSFSDMIKKFVNMIFHPIDTIRDMLVSLTKWLADIKIPEFSILGTKFGPWYPFKKMLTIDGQDPTEVAAAENSIAQTPIKTADVTMAIPPKSTANKVYNQSAEVKASEQSPKIAPKTNNVVSTQQINNQTNNAIFKNPVRNNDNTYTNYLQSKFAI